MFTINIYIYNQPSEDFAEEDHKVVVVLVCARCTKHAWLWSCIEWARFLWHLKSETPVLICGILFFRLQNRRLKKFLGPWFLHLKRFIVKDHSCTPIKVEAQTRSRVMMDVFLNKSEGYLPSHILQRILELPREQPWMIWTEMYASSPRAGFAREVAWPEDFLDEM